MKNITVKDPITGESVELIGVPDGLSNAQAAAQHFKSQAIPLSGGQAATRQIGEFGTGLAKGVLENAKFIGQIPVGLTLAGLQALGQEGAAESVGKGALGLENALQTIPGVSRFIDFADRPPKTAGGFPKAIGAGLSSAVSIPGGPVSPAFRSFLGATSGGLAQGASNAELPPVAVTGAAILPFLLGGKNAVRQPSAISQVKQALEGTTPEQVAKARSLLVEAEARGVKLSPAQLFGDDHPLVAILSRVGGTLGGGSQLRQFLLAQETPVNKAITAVTESAGNVRGQEAAALVGDAATRAVAARNETPGQVAGPMFEAATNSPLAEGAFAKASADLSSFVKRKGFAPTSNAVAEAESAQAKMVQGLESPTPFIVGADGRTSLTPGVRLGTGPDGRLVALEEPKPIFPETAGAAKSLRDDLRAKFKAFQQAGTGGSATATANEASRLVREASKTSPELAAADEAFSREMAKLAATRRDPVTFLARGPGELPGTPIPIAKLDEVLDPARFSPTELENALGVIKSPETQPVTAMLASRLIGARENARKSGKAFSAPDVSRELRGGPGSERRDMLSALIRKSIEERNLGSTGGPQNPGNLSNIINSTLDVAQASGRGRGGLGSLGNASRQEANMSPTVAGMRLTSSSPLASSASTTAQIFSFLSDRKLAQILSKPELEALFRANDFSKPALLADLIKQATLVNNAVGE